jgi:hypothetical protein
MDLWKNSTRLFFLATLNFCYTLYNLFIEDWVNVIITITNFFILMFVFSAIENEIEENQRKKLARFH